jgi:hypothetical protein
VEIQEETKMKNVLITAMLVSTISTSAMAWDTEKRYEFIPAHEMEDDNPCTTSDVVIGATAGITFAVVAGVTAVAYAPVMGAASGVASGASYLGLTGALSQPFLVGSTLPAIGVSTVIGAPLVGAAGYYASCVTRAVW